MYGKCFWALHETLEFYHKNPDICKEIGEISLLVMLKGRGTCCSVSCNIHPARRTVMHPIMVTWVHFSN